MDPNQRPQQIFLHQQLPEIPPPYSPDNRFPFWNRLILCVLIGTVVGFLVSIRAIGRSGNFAKDFTAGLILVAASAAIGSVGGLVWIGADYLEFRNQRGLRTSPLFAHFFCMGITSVMLWSLILFPLIFIGTLVVSFLSIT